MNSSPRVVVSIAVASFLTYSISSWFLGRRRRFRVTTALPGPKRIHPFWGWTQTLVKMEDTTLQYDSWTKTFGGVFTIPTVLWNRRVVLADPKAVAHFFAHDPTVYVHNTLTRVLLDATHKRLRKTLAPAFSLAAIRRLTDTFFDCAHKARVLLETQVDAGGGETVLDVQELMNQITIDSIGIAGFGHNFGSLDGKHSAVVDILSAFSNKKRTILDITVFMLSMVFPRFFTRIPTTAPPELLTNNKRETKALGEYSAAEKSIIGLLIKAESATGARGLTKEEVTTQMNLILMAGYETTSISLTFALIELSRNPSVQAQLREELCQFPSDPTFDQLLSSTTLPLLDAVVHEVLRLHPPIHESSHPRGRYRSPLPSCVTSTGDIVDRITIAKDTPVSVHIKAINRSVDFWGPDAEEFNPSRWLQIENKDLPVNDISGYRHLLTFSDGPRTCLGKTFALAEFKEISRSNSPMDLKQRLCFKRTMIRRPKVVGEEGTRVPLRVKRV
ncbi:cytochrome P450 [Flagelloscypha sp. PMI_526]|nr:cytochrome P450 [Flagelloscypha sp. PMI_526]